MFDVTKDHFQFTSKYTAVMEEVLDWESEFVARGYQYEPVLNADLKQSDCSSSEDNDMDVEHHFEPLPNNNIW